jgi:hypothetical protein
MTLIYYLNEVRTEYYYIIYSHDKPKYAFQFTNKEYNTNQFNNYRNLFIIDDNNITKISRHMNVHRYQLINDNNSIVLNENDYAKFEYSDNHMILEKKYERFEFYITFSHSIFGKSKIKKIYNSDMSISGKELIKLYNKYPINIDMNEITIHDDYIIHIDIYDFIYDSNQLIQIQTKSRTLDIC